VSFMRFLVPLWVFIFGIIVSPSCWAPGIDPDASPAL